MQEYKSFDEQIEILQNRGLIIENIDEAKQILRIHNYYNVINGYKELFCYIDDKGTEKYKEGSTVDLFCRKRILGHKMKDITFDIYTSTVINKLYTEMQKKRYKFCY